MLPAAPLLKQPSERALLRFEIGQPGGVPLVALHASSITAAGRVAPVTPLTSDSTIVGSTYVQLRLLGGTVGELYRVSAVAEDSAGNRFEADREVYVLELGFREAAGTAPYLSIADFVARAGVDEAVRLTDELGANAIDAPRLLAALTDAQAMIDAQLAARYAVPLAAPAPAPIPTLTYDLAVARLYRDALPEGVAAKQAEAIRLLKDLAAGRAALPIAAAPTDSSPAPVIVEPHERLFTRARLAAGF
jgi:phage gp36-like protein